MKYGCIGEKLGHSFSKEIHNLIAEYEYEIREIEKDKLSDFMSEADFNAINVTIPYKEAVIPYLDSIDEHAKKIGAVNTVVKKDGRLYGYNTDFSGMVALINKLGLDVHGRKAAILGSGGTAKTAKAVLSYLGAKEIITVSRKADEGRIDYCEFYSKHTDTEIIVNTTPVGMYPNNDLCPVEIDKFNSLVGVIDAVYNPIKTNLILSCERKGVKALGGLYMLIMQAIYASEFFTDSKIDQSIAEKIYKKLICDKTNIVLTGMPSCGKSTVGKVLAKELSKEFVDTDALIEKQAGKPIPEIFRESGEARFREIESEVIHEISKKNGLVIATGGGAILNENNVAVLKQNGKIYFIDRDLELLFPTDSRPLSSDREALTALYNARHGLYEKRADLTICSNGSIKEATDKIKEDFYR